MKQVAYILTLVAILLTGCTAPQGAQVKNNSKAPKPKTAIQYLNRYQEDKIVPSLGAFGWEKVEEYWTKVPELRELRSEFEKTNKILQDHKAKSSAYTQEGHNGLQMAKRRRHNALFTSNIKTLEYMINDYAKQGLEFPTDWMRVDLGYSTSHDSDISK